MKRGEIPVNRDQSTSVKGLFAAGDATDVEEKQISIVVGQGALAALAAQIPHAKQVDREQNRD